MLFGALPCCTILIGIARRLTSGIIRLLTVTTILIVRHNPQRTERTAIMDKQRLELTWIGKDRRPRPEPRILLEDTEKSRLSGHSNWNWDTENCLIHGDNLLALKSLEQDYYGKVKCVYIDPPYNTGSAFEHYDDCLEHSIWLNLMRARLELLYNLLANDGSIWISIDDNEHAYLKILCDEIFGRRNFVTSVCWQKIHSIKNDARLMSINHDFILVYAKNVDLLKLNLLPRTDTMNARFTNPDNDPRGPWSSGDLVANEPRTNGNFIVMGPTGLEFNVPANKHWVYSQENLEEMVADNRIWFGPNGTAFPRKKRFLSEVQQGRCPDSWWKSDEVGHNQEAKREVKAFNSDEIFATPKPERLIARVLTLATNPGDLVLDSFLGSGTTTAVAHKMGRRWIGVELGEHCYTHCLPRLEKVISGEDQGGISQAVNWNGGGGFRFYELAPTLIVKDHLGIAIFNPKYNSAMLTRAVCKLNGFRYNPNPEFYWMQGQGSERDYIYVTTQHMTKQILDWISDSVGSNRSLLVCCGSYRCNPDDYENLTIKKIPQSVLNCCEWGKDDYSLKVAALPCLDAPLPEPIKADSSKPAASKPTSRKKTESTDDQPTLFEEE